MGFYSFTVGDLIVILVGLASLMMFIVSYNSEWHGPSIEDFDELKAAYEQHVKDDKVEFDRINDKLTSLAVSEASQSATLVAVKETLDRIEKRI